MGQETCTTHMAERSQAKSTIGLSFSATVTVAGLVVAALAVAEGRGGIAAVGAVVVAFGAWRTWTRWRRHSGVRDMTRDELR